MKQQLLNKLKLDSRSLSWFWKKNVEKQCGIMYATFMNQLSGRGKIRKDVLEAIKEFLSV